MIVSCFSLATSFAVSPRIPVVPVVPLSVVPDVGTALDCCGYCGSIRSRFRVSSMQGSNIGFRSGTRKPTFGFT